MALAPVANTWGEKGGGGVRGKGRGVGQGKVRGGRSCTPLLKSWEVPSMVSSRKKLPSLTAKLEFSDIKYQSLKSKIREMYPNDPSEKYMGHIWA